MEDKRSLRNQSQEQGNSSLPCNKSTDGKKRTSELSKIEAELILEANRLQLMKQDLEKAENAYLSSFTSKKSKTLPGATAAAHGDPNGNNDYQKKSGDFRLADCVQYQCTLPAT
ncbi:hypothetical protein TNCV_3415791, partial [Trichonephila clavipes]